jgi:hypothetical protein
MLSQHSSLYDDSYSSSEEEIVPVLDSFFTPQNLTKINKKRKKLQKNSKVKQLIPLLRGAKFYKKFKAGT